MTRTTPTHAALPILDSVEIRKSRSFRTVEALDALWAEASQRPLWASLGYIQYIKLRWRHRLDLVSPESVEVVAPKHKVNDCAQCTDTCCVGPKSAVLLRLRDLATLHDLGRQDLIAREKPRFSQAQIDKHPALARQVQSTSWRRFPVLKQDSMGACLALTLNGKCGLYPHWPLACARFPYALHSDLEDVFYSRRCDSFWIRPDGQEAVMKMKLAAVTAYNERIKDLVLLAYAPQRLKDLGLMSYLVE